MQKRSKALLSPKAPRLLEFAISFQDTSSDYSDYVTVFIQSFIKLLADSHERVQSQAWDTLAVVTASFDAAAQQKHISSVRQALRYIRNDEIVLKTGTLPGFCLPKKVMCEVDLWFFFLNKALPAGE